MSGKLTLISSATASDSASVEFTSGIDSTYDEYVFYLVDIHPSSDANGFRVAFGYGATPTYGMTKTTTVFLAYHSESGSSSGLTYYTSGDLAQSTSPNYFIYSMGNGASQSGVGEVKLFSPSSTSKVKHFYTRSVNNRPASSPSACDYFTAGYVNDASNAITAAKFTPVSNTFSGNIYMYGVS